jgi:hypothetical protein
VIEKTGWGTWTLSNSGAIQQVIDKSTFIRWPAVLVDPFGGQSQGRIGPAVCASTGPPGSCGEQRDDAYFSGAVWSQVGNWSHPRKHDWQVRPPYQVSGAIRRTLRPIYSPQLTRAENPEDEPTAGELTASVPPVCPMMVSTIARPRPTPPGRLVPRSKRRVRLASLSGGTPVPRFELRLRARTVQFRSTG